jgi:2-methylcitrate dehydratase PrpD
VSLAEIRSDAGAGATRHLIRLACHLGYDDLDAATRHAAKRHILDTLGAIVAGAQQKPSEIAEAVLASTMPAGVVPVPGRARRADPLSAAYLAGVSAHGLELDDGYRAGSVHPGAVVVPAALAAAHLSPCDGEALIAAVVVGYEIACRIAETAHPHARWRGFHNTSTAGVFAAAGAAGVLLGLDEAQMGNALGLAASSAGGLFAFMNGGGDVKRLHPGHAAREGLQAALQAQRGMEGPPDVLEGRDGFFQAFAGGDVAKRDYGAVDLFASPPPFAITQCYVKPHACCRHIQPALDAMLALLNAHDLAPDDVAAVEVGTYAVAASHAASGWENMATAQLSFPFVMATGLRKRRVTLHDFDEAARCDPETVAACAKIEVTVADAAEADYPRRRPAEVRLVTTDGRAFENAVDEASGDYLYPLDDDALAAKFTGLVMPVLGAERTAAALDALWRLDSAEAAGAVAELLVPAV